MIESFEEEQAMEFHISRQSRDRYQFDQSLYALNGNVIFANFHAARVFAQKMNDRRDLITFPEQAVQAGQINAMGMIDEILHLVMQNYRQERNRTVNAKAIAWLSEEFGEVEVQRALYRFAEEFPPIPVYRREISLEEYMAGATDGMSHREAVFEEMLMLWLANLNPAFSPFQELFNDAPLSRDSAYAQITKSLHEFFETQPGVGAEDKNLIDMLRAPALAHPYSLEAQLEYIRTHWSALIGKQLYRLLTSMDLIKEEQKAIFLGPGPSIVYEFAGLEFEPEQFSPDRDWMPSLVLIAKNAYVWLDQLSKKYRLHFTRLDQIPDEALDELRQAGITGLWLIGLWERSPASKRIKQLRGNPDAVASAYSLFSYDIAADLGGEESYRILRDRAWAKGIRLASDMVPNHMGIDSRWLIEHPDWFISLDHSPFPSYTFNGPDLSWDERVGIYIEDHYFDNTDAAVVFKRIDKWTGQQRYVYHGNDGTSMPWNDTAQLDYLKAEVREAVIQTILHVARKFPVIRFDAAMTLAKRHYARLWYPEPGSGGDIPSRAEYGLSKEQFEAAMPLEFWRELVDRVAQEAPDTLLLAEAFWLMEGYFVRTLGMHRVYNSAFMNMLRDEKNQEYRLVIKNTLEFDPEILKRYVNFMNNPDERTAVEQYGKGDKYFGTCTMLATLPGLPMFGHGQIEGFTEKYGMEYRRAYWEEQPDEQLVNRHEREIFPLLRKRYIFAEAENFRLYDFFTNDGHVDEDVFAYSNRSGAERALVVYHNRFASAQGWIRTSTGYPVKVSDDERQIQTSTLAEGLALSHDSNRYTIFRDHRTGMEYIRSSQELEEKGLYLELDAYQYHVFLGFREVQDDALLPYSQLCFYLNGRGVPSIEEALTEILLQPIHNPFRELVNAGQLNWLIENRITDTTPPEIDPAILSEVEEKALDLLEEIKEMVAATGDAGEIASQISREVARIMALPALETIYTPAGSDRAARALQHLIAGLTDRLPFSSGEPFTWGTLLCWVIVYHLGEMVSATNPREISRAWIDEWLLAKIIAAGLIDLGLSQEESAKSLMLIRVMSGHADWYEQCDKDQNAAIITLQSWLRDTDIQRFLQINRYQGVLWFNREAFEELAWWLTIASLISSNQEIHELDDMASAAAARFEIMQQLLAAEQVSGYQVEKLLAAVKSQV
jgi:glycosidase